MANHQINITENGTKTLLTAGKYCDRNVDVVVNVPTSGGLTPTTFTNILDLDTTIVKHGYRVISTGYTETADGVAIVTPCSAGNHRIRFRGNWVSGYLATSTSNNTSMWRANFYQSTATPTDSTFAGKIINDVASSTYLQSDDFGIDEYGDCYIDFTTTADCYIGFTLKNMSVIFPNSTFACDPIVTIDEPIGYVEVTA